MPTRNEELRIAIRLDEAGQLSAELGGVRKNLDEVGRSGKGASGGLGALSGVAGELKGLLPALGIAGAVTGLVALGKSAFETAGRLSDVADRTGVSAESLQELQYAADQAGVSAGGMERALEGFARRTGEARTGTGSLVTALRDQNAELLRGIQTASSTEEALDLVFEAIANTESAADRAALANAAFGRSGVELLPILSQGTAGLEAMRQRARDLGLVLGNDLVNRGDAAGDALGELASVVKTNLYRVLLEAAPIIKDVSGALTELAASTFGFLGTLNSKIAEFASLTRQKFTLSLEYGSVELAQQRLAALRSEIAALEASGTRGPEVDSRRREAGRIEDLLTAPTAGPAAPASGRPGAEGGAGEGTGGAGQTFVGKLQQELEDLDFETALAGLSKFEQQIASAQQRVAALGVEGGASAETIVASADAMGEAVERNLQAQNFASGIEGLRSLTAEARNLSFAGPEAEFQKFMVSLNEQLAQGEISVEQYRQQVELARQQFALLNDGSVIGVFEQLEEGFRRVETEAKVFGTSVADENADKLSLLRKAMQDLIALGVDPSSKAFSTLKSQLDSASPSLSGIEDASKRLQGEFESAATASGKAFRQIEEDAGRAAENEALGRTLPAKLKTIKDDAGNIKIVADGTEAEQEIGGVEGELEKLVESFNKANPKVAIDTSAAVEGLVVLTEKGVEARRSFEGVPILVKVNTGDAKSALESLQADAAKSPNPALIRVDTSGAVDAINALRAAASQPIVIPVRASGSPSLPFSDYFGSYATGVVEQFLGRVSGSTLELYTALSEAARAADTPQERAQVIAAIEREENRLATLRNLGVQRNLDTGTGKRTDLSTYNVVLAEIRNLIGADARAAERAEREAERRHRESNAVGVRMTEELSRLREEVRGVRDEQRKNNDGWASGRYAAPIVGATSRGARFAGIPN